MINAQKKESAIIRENLYQYAKSVTTSIMKTTNLSSQDKLKLRFALILLKRRLQSISYDDCKGFSEFLDKTVSDLKSGNPSPVIAALMSETAKYELMDKDNLDSLRKEISENPFIESLLTNLQITLKKSIFEIDAWRKKNENASR